MTSSALHFKCGTCRTSIAKEGNEHFPFCSDRCRLLDLDRWLGEKYRISMPLTERNALADVPPPDEDSE